MPANNLRNIHAFPDLVRYLEDELDWPLQEYGFDELTFEYTPAELGLKEEDAAHIKAIYQLRPLASGQPWGIFFVEFENKKLPVVVLRRILSHRYEVCVARRGASDRNEAIRSAIDHAERDFVSRYGFGRGGDDAWTMRVSTPKSDACLQAADYFLWAVQRFYEPRVDTQTGASKQDERFLKLIWPQVGEIHDLHFGPAHGTFFNRQKPLSLEERFGEQKKKKP